MNNGVRQIIDQQAETRGSQAFLISPENDISVSCAGLQQSARENGPEWPLDDQGNEQIIGPSGKIQRLKLAEAVFRVPGFPCHYGQ